LNELIYDKDQEKLMGEENKIKDLRNQNSARLDELKINIILQNKES
jgi:hypothetical protein